MTGISITDHDLRLIKNDIAVKANRTVEPILYLMFMFGIFLAFFYSTWLIAAGSGTLCLLAYWATKKILPDSNLYQYVLSSVCTVFAAQYIYQMHGLAEMHFWVFISSTMLIIYQNWRLQVPLIILVYIHHSLFAWLQYSGYKEAYFTQLDYMDLATFIFHAVLATVICLISGLWSYFIYKRTVQDALNYKRLFALQHEITEKNEKLLASEEELRSSAEELTQINDNLNLLVADRTKVLLYQNEKLKEHAFINAHKVRSPLARIQGLVNLISIEVPLNEKATELLNHLRTSTTDLDKVLVEVRVNLESDELPANGDEEVV